MSLVFWLVTHHVLAILVGVLSFVFASSALNQRRPTGSAAAWLLAIVLIPYVGIPLYLAFGGRKVGKRALRKRPLPVGGESLALTFRALGRPETAQAAPVAGPSQALDRDHVGAHRPHDVPARVVDWLTDGVAAYETFLVEIARAKRTIRIQTFLIGSDPTGRGILDALAARASAGVEVRLLLDDLLRFRAPRESLAKLTAAGGRIERFMPLIHVPFRGRTNLRNHRKIAVFDGERAIVGGMNLADEYMGPKVAPNRFRDLSVRVRGSTVTALDAVFRADWDFVCGEELPAVADHDPSDPVVRLVPSGPDCPTDPIYDAILTAAFRAERRLWVATPYFVPDEGLARALEVAAHRGVDVRVVVPYRSNHLLADLAAAPCLRELADAGGKVLRYEPAMLHAKAVLVDDSLAIVGSANFDMRSLFLDYEIAVFFAGDAEIEQLSRWFETTMETTSQGPPRSGRLRTQAENLCRLLAPLL